MRLRQRLHTGADSRMLSGDSVVRIAGLSVAFGGLKALTEIDLEIQPGEIVGIVGANGSGKSTLLNATGGLLRGAQVSGQVSVLNQPHGRRAAQLAAAGLGRSFQDPKLLEDTIMENLLCGAHPALRSREAQIGRRGPKRTRWSDLEDRAFELLDEVDLVDQAWDQVGGKPYGTRKLADLARAFMGDPRLALLDEPSSGLDTQDRTLVVRLLRRLREASPVSMIVVEHHFELLREVADRVVALSAGRVVVTGTAATVLDSTEFRDILTGSAASTFEPDGGAAPASEAGLGTGNV